MNAPGHAVDLELDCRTLPCPMPVIELARHLTDVEVGEVPAWCRMKQQHYVGADAADDGAPRYVVRRLS